ncbi:TPA: hypothetical protein N0F65_004516 [Lagenidium giganteum]|uniref:LsmAD domain-containing protein n=1 Tax=Lagenidium giganteum TaxID=4803 RepID=A0AAV2YUP8_9STRA|nr:TPA: hypothetical protein N0F65_004516 [Lagenidium giganteum]
MQQTKAAPAGPLPRKNSTGSKNKKKKASDTKPKSNGAAPASSTQAPPPGFADAPKPALSEQHQRFLRHRALFAFRYLVGKAVDVHLVDGSSYVGILDCIEPDTFSVVLKNTQRKGQSSEPFQSGSTVIIKRLQISHMSADGLINYSEAGPGTGPGAAGFRTDTEISGRGAEHLFDRELQAASSWLDPALDTGELEDPRSGSKGNWNQFEVNEKLFGVVSTFDENLYTTKLDRGKISSQQSREAERLAKEIERQTSSNFHLQEERGHAVAHDGIDEEARYSSVDRRNSNQGGRGSNAYLPPALRNAQAKTAGGKQPTAKPAATSENASTAPKSVPTPAPPATPTDAAAPAPASIAAPAKPLSFSDAVRGKTATTPAAAAAPPAPPAPEKAEPKVSSPKKVTANGDVATKQTTETPAAKPAAKEATKPTKATADSTAATSSAAGAKPAAPASAPKKGLNPNAKEFKLNATAAAFTPKFATTTASANTGSPYRGGHHQPHHGMHLHNPQHPSGAPMYAPPPEEWMFEGGMPVEDGEMPPHMYMHGYGVPVGPSGVMQQPMYPPMMPPQHNVRMMGGHRMHGGGYGYPQQGPYNPRFYPPGAPGMSYPAMTPQPPLPRDPSPGSAPSSPAIPPVPAPTSGAPVPPPPSSGSSPAPPSSAAPAPKK